MTPEEAGIVSMETHIRHLTNWMIENNVDTFKLSELPEQFGKRWHTKSVYSQRYEAVSKDRRHITTWKLTGIHENSRQRGTRMEVTGMLHNAITFDAVKDSIQNGIHSPISMARRLHMSQSATYRALRKFHEAGKINRTIKNNYLHYSLKEA